MKRTFQEDLDRAVAFHGHVCGGQVIGTRMARLGLAHFGIESPEDYKDLVICVEADRCLADALTIVANCSLGRRRLKWYDYGKMAATFYDLQSGKAIRIASVNQSRPGPDDTDIVAFYNAISDEQMFKIEEVEVNLTKLDLPGKPQNRVTCARCGEDVLDGREVVKDGQTLCKPCAGEPAYYHTVD